MQYKNIITVTAEEVTRKFADHVIGGLHASVDDFTIDDTIEHMQAIQEDLERMRYMHVHPTIAATAFQNVFNSYEHADLLPDDVDAEAVIKWDKMNERYAIVIEGENGTVLTVIHR